MPVTSFPSRVNGQITTSSRLWEPWETIHFTLLEFCATASAPAAVLHPGISESQHQIATGEEEILG